MKLYNVCLPEDLNVSVFKPRIPEFRARGEDNTTARICLSSSLSGCVSAVIWGGINFENMVVDLGLDFKGYPIKVYEFDSSDIEESNLISPEKLYEEDLVGDAIINQEYWVVNQDLKPRKTYYITVKDFTEEVHDSISFENLKEIDRLDSLNESYDYNDYLEGCFTKIIIEDFEYIDEKDLVIDDTFKIHLSNIENYSNDEELLEVIENVFNNFLVLDNSVESVYIEDGFVIIETNEKCSIIMKDFMENIKEELEFVKN